ncbi:NADP-dependent oxidoreductase [Amycolatopsis jiangsuensis]|uniref:NADPH:quinone reductase-like Zn-dependent oxidoreductase n=1 Tax=Amycolatopsis jiangsuensis TaxID=1181879 RepID=A0A840INX7_9PSEU|nr:NADP-dependent oxidoreductase [Amycolatopsis jiangsuensis]MBB4682908.1 NADPH:quinone reductase-like Zn-dependent oxidoreductase [Amycolatopsis jiangsuensis]
MATHTMRAVRLHEHGGPEVLRYDEVPVPEPQPGEVLVRVHAIGVNPPDWYLRGGMTTMPGETEPSLRLPVIPGTDVSGVVEAVGPDVETIGPDTAPGAGGFAPGDEVFGMLRFPSFNGNAYAEYVAAPVSDLTRKPAGIDHVHAAGAPMAGLTAWQFLIEVGHDHPSPFQEKPHQPTTLDTETTVLVNGAAGGVGHFALQLAKWKGAQVVAVASGAHEAFLTGLGADRFIDYTRNRPEELVTGADLVLDTVGGPGSSRLLRTLKRGGAHFAVFPGDFDDEEIAKLGVTVSIAQVRSNGSQLAELGHLLDTGTVRVAIDSTFALADARLAHERAARGHLQGKLVLTV